MNKIETAGLTVESSIKECTTHIKRIDRVLGLTKSFFPLSVARMEEDDEELIEHIDQLIYRFSKLQDSMGIRLIPSIYTVLENDDNSRPFLDILNRLEKIGILSSASEWQFFRNLRNNLAHDYLETLEQTVDTLNILYTDIGKLKNMFFRLRDEYTDRLQGSEAE